VSFFEQTQIKNLKFEIEFKDCGIELAVSTILTLLLIILWAHYFLISHPSQKIISKFIYDSHPIPFSLPSNPCGSGGRTVKF